MKVRIRSIDIQECRSMDELHELVRDRFIAAGMPPRQFDMGRCASCARLADSTEYEWLPTSRRPDAAAA